MDCSIDNDLRKKIKRAVECRNVLCEARGKEFPPALMRRYSLGTLPGNSFGNSINISIAESISPKNAIKGCKASLTTFSKLPTEIRYIMYE